MLSFFPLLFSLLQPAQPPFKAQTIDSTVAIGYGLAVGDVDGDGRQDILLADQKQFVWYRNGDWKKFVMIENLTSRDNVCIAARDLNGDGKVEVAVGAQWNPAETSNKEASGSVHYLVAPADVTQPWKAVQLYHEPTIHRMRWVKDANNTYFLAVLPLHGIGNKDGTGKGVNLLLYRYPDLFKNPMPYQAIETGMHLTHNVIVVSDASAGETLGVAGKEGLLFFKLPAGGQQVKLSQQNITLKMPAGELRAGRGAGAQSFIATIEPMHGREVVVYKGAAGRTVIDSGINEGHALATADFLGRGSDQIVAGWRAPGKEGTVGIKLYTQQDAQRNEWTSEWIDEAGMACEDIQVGDLNGDGSPDIVASGRSTHNLKIYWNQSGK